MLEKFQRQDIENLKSYGLSFEQPWMVVDYFEKLVAEYFGAKYAVAVDCCTHGLELCLRLLPKHKTITKIPAHTYMSVPMTFEILNIPYQLVDLDWQEFYHLDPYPIIDAATQWRKNSYIPGTYTVISFQFQKHLSIGKGGMILLDHQGHYEILQKMTRDGRDRTLRHDVDNVNSVGFHYHMTPEDAARGINLFMQTKDSNWQPWGHSNYTDLRLKDVFCGK